MGKFDNVRKTIRRNKNKIHIMYVAIFVLFMLVVGLYIQNHELNTKKEMKSNLEWVREIYENDKESKDSRIKELESLNIQYNSYLDSLPFGSPVDILIVRSEFGWRNDPFSKSRSFHKGIDLHTEYRQPILATGNGTIVRSSWYSGFGNCVEIEHPLGYRSLYGHLDKFFVKVGDNVSKGDTIGLAGSTGKSTAVHLHYEILLNSESIDPYKYLQYFNIETLELDTIETGIVVDSLVVVDSLIIDTVG